MILKYLKNTHILNFEFRIELQKCHTKGIQATLRPHQLHFLVDIEFLKLSNSGAVKTSINEKELQTT